MQKINLPTPGHLRHPSHPRSHARHERKTIPLLFNVLFLFSFTLFSSCTRPAEPPEQTTTSKPELRIFWRRGFYPEEDQAVQTVANEWQQQTSIPVKISFLSPDDVLNQAVIALENGNPPDIVFAHRADYTLEPQWAWQDKLVDVSDVVATVQDQFNPIALDAAYLYNKTTGKKSYYGVPIEMQALHIHYWRDRLSQLGLSDADIPNDWNGFWQFWENAQVKSQVTSQAKAQPNKIYGLGLTLSPASSDSFFLFEQLLEVYDIDLLDQQGKLRLREPQVRQGMIQVLEWLTQRYKQIYIPPTSLNWVDSDNNVNFLNHSTLMTANPSLSIPVSQKNEPELYNQQIASRAFPLEPDGETTRYLVSVKQALILKGAKNPEAAKSFLKYFIQPDRLNTYMITALGRWFPVMPSALKHSFWKNTADPHISTAVKQFAGETRPFYHVLNPAYSQVQAESVWGQAIQRVLVDGVTPEAAVDEAIARIEKIFTEW